MATTNIFEYATRNKLRFTSKKGNLTTEQLWDLNVESLDEIYKDLNKEMKSFEGDSLLKQANPKNEELTVSIEIIKHIVTVKLAEKTAKEAEVARKLESQKIMKILAEREDKALENLSEEDLRKRLAELNQ